MEFERASLEMVGPVAVLRMNDPDVLNALSPSMIKGMTDALDALAAAETPARCLVLTGTGDVLEPENGVMGIGSGGNYALAAARALVDTEMDAESIVRKAMRRIQSVP